MARDLNIRAVLKMKRRGRTGFVEGYLMPEEVIPGWVLVRKKPIREKNGLRLSSYIWRPEGVLTGQLLKWEVLESHSAEEAMDSTQNLVDHMMGGHLMEPAADHGVDVGEFGLLNPKGLEPGEVLQFLTYTRQNLTFKFNSVGDEDISVREFAQAIDGMFEQARENTALGGGLELVFSADKKRFRVGEEILLTHGHKGDPALEVWYMIVANTEKCEIFRRDGKVYLVAHRPGKIDLLLISFEWGSKRSRTEFSVRILP